MRYNPSNKSKSFKSLGARFLKKTLKLLTLGISAQQWTACMLICALLSLSVAAPVGVSMPRAVNNDFAAYEPVNEDVSIFTSTLRDLNAEIEATLTPWRTTNWSTEIVDEKDKVKKAATKSEKPETDATKKEDVPVEDVAIGSGNRAGHSAKKPDLLESEEGNYSSSLTTSSDDITARETESSTSALEKRVAGIKTEIKSSEEVKIGQLISLAARPVDRKGGVVNGVVAKWHCADSKVVRILNDSQAVAVGEGETKLVVYLGKFVKELPVKVVKGQGAKTAQNSLLPDPELPVITDQQAANLVTPENNLGNPVGQTEMSSRTSASATQTRERYGSSNYSFGIPAASLPGRGMDASVGITYNSRVWNKSGASGTRVFSFNIDNNWLAPGFETGFGDITPFGGGSVSGYMLTGPEGTRHQLIYKQASGSCSIFESTDGTFIQTTICGIYTSSTLNVIFPDGTQVMYGGSTASGKRFPVRITDRNGNMLNIAYIQGDSQGKIAYVRDTLNRYINFHYETGTTDKKLVAITVPGYNSGAERQTIRFYYEDLTLQTTGRFEETATVIAPTTPIKVLKYVYFPGTQTGFRYDYSPYFGVIHKIWQLRGMTVNSPTTTDTGTVNDNPAVDPTNWAAWTRYNYPATLAELPAVALDDVPTFEWRKDDWQGRTAAVPTTTFASSEDTSGCDPDSGTCTGTRTTIITAPDQSRSVSVSLIRPALDWQNGLMDETRLETQTGVFTKVWSKTKLYWEQGPDNQLPGRDNPRLDKVEVTNDAGQTRATSFDYDNYNNQTVVREHDFADEGTLGNELRRTETSYETGLNWIANRLLRLPTEIKTIVNGQTVAKTKFEYDNGGVPLSPSNITYREDISTSVHSIQYQPAAPPGEQCAPQCEPHHRCCWEVPVYQERTRFRGNVTKVIAFPNTSLADNDPANNVTTIKYDIAGNVTETSGGCCDLKTTQYVNTNHYAYPISETRSGQGLSLTTSVTYDHATGVVLTATNENGQPSSVTYNPTNVRVIRTDSPNGAWTTTEYNDTVFPYYVKTTASLDATRSVSGWSFTNGIGQQFRMRGQTVDGYVSSDVEFDIMGRPVKSFNPYTVANLTDARPSTVKFSEIAQRDGLGRTLLSTLPDLTTVSATYNGLVATATDQAGKQRRQLADALGRTVRVDEPDANGNLGDVATPAQPTNYEYDGNDNLTKVTQTGNGATQERLFKYDALSRLTHERQVEATATLNDAGIKVSSGGLWTKVMKYNDEGQLIDDFDARGVRTQITYDGLKRVSTVTYSGEVGNQTPTVTYTYDQARSGFFNNGALTKVETAAVGDTPSTKTEFDYDLIGRVRKHRQWIGTQQYDLEYEYNLAGQLISERYPSGRIVTNSYDGHGRLSGIADAARTYVSNLQYQGLGGGMSSMSFGNGVTQTFIFSDRFQLKEQEIKRGSETLQKYSYGYGQIDSNGNLDTSKNNGQLAQVESWIGTAKQWTKKFSYDPIGRLSSEQELRGDNGAQVYKNVYDFDRFGNMYRKATNNGAALPYTAIEDAHINKSTNRFTSNTTYDEAGNVAQDTKFRNLNYSYDANGRMFKTSNTAQTNQSNAIYDSAGMRVATQVDGVWTFFVYNILGKMVAEYGGLAGTDDGGVKYVLQDWQGSTRGILSNTGNVQARTDYSAYGEEINAGVGQRTTAQGFGVGNNLRQKYGLTERDQASGLDHTWFRKNENLAGRWTSPDPYRGSMQIGNPQSFNRYSYVNNNPVNFIDPTGLLCYGYHVFEVWFYPDTGQIIDIIYLGFITTYCDDSGGNSGGGGGGGGGGGDHTSPNPSGEPADKDKCKFPGYDKLSDAQKKLVDKDLYNSLTDAQKANFLNQTGVLARNGIDLGDARLQPGGIRTDRLLFDSSNLGTFQSSVNNAITRGVYSSDTPVASEHPGMSSSGARENRTRNSQQIGFGPDGAFVDIDRGNPDNGLLGLAIHIGEWITPGSTDPFAVGRRLGSNVTGYTCKK